MKTAKRNERLIVKILDTNTIYTYVISIKRLKNPSGSGYNWEIKAYDTYNKPHTYHCRWYRTVKGKILENLYP